MKWLIVVAVVIYGFYLIGKNEEKKKRKREIIELAKQAQEQYDRFCTLKTSSARINAAKKALGLIAQAEKYEEAHDVVSNLGDMKAQLKSRWRVLPVIEAVEKSYKHKFKGREKAELNALQDAMYQIKTNSVTNDDIERAEIMPEGTGEIVTIEGIQRRCKELGWEPKH